MNLDTFLISLVFDAEQTKSSAKKIDGIVQDLTKSIIKSFAAIGAMDFLKSAVEGFTKLSTQLDNLSYQTNISTSNLQAWGEAAKRAGGTTEGFYTSISNLSQKLRDVQTSFGSEGQLAFARLGINIKDVNGHVKNAVQVLGDLGDKFKTLPKVWQLNLGKQLGLDDATIRLLASGDQNVAQLVEHMKQLGLTNQTNVKSGVEYRNTMFDLQLVWQSLSNSLVSLVLPPLEKFTKLITGVMVFLQKNSYLVEAGLIAISTVITAIMIPAFIRLAVAMSSFLAVGAIIAGITLVIQDFIVWLHGGKSALGDLYTSLFGTKEGALKFFNEVKEGLKHLKGFGVELLLLTPILFKLVKWFLKLTGSISAIKEAAKDIGLATELEKAGEAAVASTSKFSKLLSIIKGIGAAAVGIGALAGITELVTKLQDSDPENIKKYGSSNDRFHEIFTDPKKFFANFFSAIPESFKSMVKPFQPDIDNLKRELPKIWDTTKKEAANIIKSTATSLGVDPNLALSVAQIESSMNVNAGTGKPGQSASGLFGLTNATFSDFGEKGANKNDPKANSTAGIKHIKAVIAKIQDTLGRTPQNWEVAMGEMVGVTGVTKILKASQDTMLSSLLSNQAIKSNNLQGMTVGQLEARAQKTYSTANKTVNQNINVNLQSNSANPKAVANQIPSALAQHAALVNGHDNGRIA